MKRISLAIFLLFTDEFLNAESCAELKASFEKDEAAYDMVARIAVASNDAYAIIGKFVDSGESVLSVCPKVYSLDRQYTLKRKIASAKKSRESYKVLTQSELKLYARSHPEEIIVYKWGKIRPVP